MWSSLLGMLGKGLYSKTGSFTKLSCSATPGRHTRFSPKAAATVSTQTSRYYYNFIARIY